MKIALLGYGKMGKAIEKIALNRNHTISFKITSKNLADIDSISFENTDVIIEFSRPESVLENIYKAIDIKVPIVVGTTGWNDNIEKVEQDVQKAQTKLIHASNFSVGVNLFFELNKKLASLMNQYSDYEVSMMEAHHLSKLDSPSGTAITLAEGILDHLDRKDTWNESVSPDRNEIGINALRQPEVYGTHLINYESNIDKIEIKHIAKSRNGFALGSLIAAEFLVKQEPGVYTMKDVLKL